MYMDNLNWNLLKSFTYVVKEGSLSGAARALGTTQPTIGRHIETLEAELGFSLFIRSREGLAPTEEGLNLLPETEAMAGSYSALLRRVSGNSPAELGTIRIAVSEIMGVEVLPDILKKFNDKNPGLKIELSISNKIDNLLKRDADIAIRMTDPKQEALIAKKIGVSYVCLYAHKNYFKKHSIPKSLEDLKAHTIIGPDTDQLFLTALKSYGLNISRDEIHFRTDNQLAQLNLLRKGLGICAMQVQLAKKEASLIPILPETISIPMPIWLVMHEDLRSSRRVRLLFDFLIKELEHYIQ